MEIKLENLTKKFNDVTAVNNVTLTLKEGELICLLGPSGCGKSTILNMLSGILPVTSGKIYFDEDDVTFLAPEKRGVGLVFQNYALYPHMTVLENISFPLEIQKVDKVERAERATEMAKLVHIDEYLKRKPKELSGGQQQRVAIARALVKQPRLLLLDEPLSNLDARLRLEMREEIRRIQLDTQVTTVFVTHDQEEAMSISDTIIIMKDGVIHQVGKPQELYDQPVDHFVANFLGNPPINNIEGYIKDGEFYTLDGAAHCKPFDMSHIEEGRKVTLAVRAESIQVHDHEVVFKGIVKSLQTMGKEELGNIQFGNNIIRAYISSDYQLKVGDEFDVGFRDKGVFLFDSETGERLI